MCRHDDGSEDFCKERQKDTADQDQEVASIKSHSTFIIICSFGLMFFGTTISLDVRKQGLKLFRVGVKNSELKQMCGQKDNHSDGKRQPPVDQQNITRARVICRLIVQKIARIVVYFIVIVSAEATIVGNILVCVFAIEPIVQIFPGTRSCMV